MPPSLRRSTRERKAVEPIYDTSSAQKKKKQRRGKKRSVADDDENDDHELERHPEHEEKVSLVSEEEKEQRGDDEDDDVVMEEASPSEVEEEDEESEAEEEEEEEEAYEEPAPKKHTPASAKKKSPAAPAARPRGRPRLSGPVATANNNNNKKKTPKKASTSRPKNRKRQVESALKALAKKALDENETPEESLALALLRTSSSNQQDNPQGGSSSIYTAGIEQICQQLAQEEYPDNPNACQVQLVNLVLQSVGGDKLPHNTDLEALSDDEWIEKIEELPDEMADRPVALLTAHPESVGGLSHTLKVATHEYQNTIYPEFWYRLARSILAVDNMFVSTLENIRDVMGRLVEWSQLLLPDVRYAIAVAMYQMGRALLDVSVDLQAKTQTAKRQHAVALRSSGGSTKSNSKAETLQSNMDTWNRAIRELEDMVKDTVLSLFVKRWRDGVAAIRVESLKMLQMYCLVRPDMFLKGLYLKYPGWLLSDKEPVVRLHAIDVLLAPFEEAMTSRIDTKPMDSVIAKFLNRLVDCTLDMDPQVQERAMKLVLVLLRHGHFDTVENDELWSQINNRALDPNHASPPVRRDALYFVMEQLQCFDNGGFASEREAAEQWTSLAQWISSTIEDNEAIPMDCIRYELADLVVASLRGMEEHKALACHWSAMLRAIKSEETRKASGDQRISMVKQRVLLRILVTAAKFELSSSLVAEDKISDPDIVAALAAFREGMQTDSVSEMKKNKRAKKSSTNAHEELTLALLRTLPDLLMSFKTETPVLQSLVTLPQYFAPSVLNVSSRKKEFQSLMKNLSSIFLESTDRETLGYCCRAMVSLATGEHSRADEAVLVLKDIASKLWSKVLFLLQSGDDRNEGADTETSIALCLRRLCALSKRWNIITLVTKDHLQDEELENISKAVSEYLRNELEMRQVIYHRAETQGDAPQIDVPEIWDDKDESVHAVVADSVLDGLDLILSMSAWRLHQEADRIDREEERDDLTEEDMKAHILVRMRDRIRLVLLGCYEQYFRDAQAENFSDCHMEFAVAVQEHALRISGDLRMLSPRQFADSKVPLLAAFALLEDAPLIGAGVRFMKARGYKIREAEEGSEEELKAVQEIILPAGRGLCTNWKSGNRREAGVTLTHITGSGKEVNQHVQILSRIFKQLNPVRLLEAHMASLRQIFGDWFDSVPEEPSDRPTEAEVAQFEEDEKAHHHEFVSILNLAARLSASLGVGEIRDKDLLSALLGFIREGVRFSFSTDSPSSDEELPLGSRLSFLLIVAKYIHWIRKKDDYRDVVLNSLNENEAELRQDSQFDEIYEDDLDALAEFRKLGNFGAFPGDYSVVDSQAQTQTQADSTTHGESTSMRPRNSLGSSVSSIRSKASTKGSLESIAEEDNDASGDEDDEDNEDHSKSSLEEATPSPTERSKMSARYSGTSISTLGYTLGSTQKSPSEKATPSPAKRSKLSANCSGSVSTLGQTLTSALHSPSDDSSTSTSTADD